MTTRAIIIPVYGFGAHRYATEAIATFFDSNDAIDYALHPDWPRNVFVGVGKYDRRTSGYRPAQPDHRAAYEAWCREVDLRRGIERDLTRTMELQAKARAA
jgi:hypothetical protein